MQIAIIVIAKVTLCACFVRKKSMHYLEEKQSTFYEDVDQVGKICSEELYSLFTIRGNQEEPIYVTMEVCEIPVEMEVDTGAFISVTGAQTYSELSKSVSHPLVLEKSNAVLKTYTGQLIPVKLILKVDLKFNNKVYKDMSLTVIEGNGPSLNGRNWLHSIRLDWNKICHIYDSGYSSFMDKYSEVFKEDLGKLKGTQMKIHLKKDAHPKFHKARMVPYAMKEKVEAELDRLQKEGIIEPVKFSEWAAPIVPVLIPDGSVRICGDFRLTVNQASHVETYPIPLIKDLYAKLAGGKKFRIFQRTTDNVLQGLNGVCTYLNDILITGSTEKEHLQNLEALLQRLKDAGL